MFYRRPFPMHANMLLLPPWVVASLKRHDLTVSDVLDFPKIRTILSMNDLISVLALQSFGDMVVGSRDIIAGPGSVICEWMNSCGGSEGDKAYLEKNIVPFQYDQISKEAVKTRLFSKDSSEPVSDKPYEVHALGDIGLGVVIYPGYFHDLLAMDLRRNLLRDMLRQLYAYEEQTVVASQPIFRSYLGHLSRQTSLV